ncbi:hypothetical protein BJY04DRAFT_227556 [Aspergillus karnatakaensis]|uniref:uncharacterized protein n=1 Tax=Aspergillus karnatakaensis TaxID=1810916 RepID=UPI003CCE52D8
MFKPRKQKPFAAPAVPFPVTVVLRRRLTLAILVLALYIIYHYIPLSFPVPSRNRTVVSGKWLPDYDTEEAPRYLHHSSFRANPDREYERKVSDALLEIEKRVLSENGGNKRAEERIWQLRLGTAGRKLEEIERGGDSLKFEEKNGDWAYTLVTDEYAHEFLTTILPTIPELKKLYDSYPYHVIRSDLLRYLLLWYYGGYYADMDVYPAKSIKQCPSLKPLFSDLGTGHTDVSLVVGVEIDEPHASMQLMRDWHWIRTYGFIQYTMFAPQRFSPLLREVIVRVLSYTRQQNKWSIPLIGPRYNEKTILEVTGPGVFTDAILDALSDSLPTTHPMIAKSVKADEKIGDLAAPWGEIDRRLTWAPFHKLQQPICVDGQETAVGKTNGGVCVLPINAWGNGQRHSGAENFRSQHACINHRFGGTWKKGWWQRHFG